MNNAILRNPPSSVLEGFMVEVIQSRIAEKIDPSQCRPGHCMRITALPENVMRDLCQRFEDNVVADVVLLLGPRQSRSNSWEVSSTRLIELRNLYSRPLLVFVPPGLKTAAEDSFDISTFEEIDLQDVVASLRQYLLGRLSGPKRQMVERLIKYVDGKEQWVTNDMIVSYLSAVIYNNQTDVSIGGAIYKLNLVPHFELADKANQMEPLLAQNIEALSVLRNAGDPLLARIHQTKLQIGSTLQGELFEFLRSRDVENISVWCSEIATDSKFHHLAFGHWRFEGEDSQADKPLLYVETPNLSKRDDPNKPLYLDLQRAGTIRIQWSTNPKPAALPNLKYFRIEILNSDRTPVWESANIRSGISTKENRSKNIKVTDFKEQVEPDEIYFFRVRAYSDVGELINDEVHERTLRDRNNPDGKRINETEDIWFWSDDKGTPPPAEPQRNLSVNSFLEAQLIVRFEALARGNDPLSSKLVPQPDRTGWSNSTAKRTDATYDIIYDAQTRFTLSISSILRDLELKTLAEPDTLGRWRLQINDTEPQGNLNVHMRSVPEGAHIPQEFLDARKELFKQIKDSDHPKMRDRLICTIDLLAHESAILQYATAYQNWLEQAQHIQNNDTSENTNISDDAIYLDIDVIEVTLNPPRMPNLTSEHVLMLAPTHPLRILWHLQSTRLSVSWIRSAIQAQKPELLTEEVKSFLRSGLLPVNLPPMLRMARTSGSESVSRFYLEQQPLTLFWGMYAREDTKDVRALTTRLSRALGLNRRNITEDAITGIKPSVVSRKISQYLAQHPYIRTLKINVFNPGDASLIVDAILRLEEEMHEAGIDDLRYEIRLFSRQYREFAGQTLDELIDPERQVSEKADAFAQPNKNHLFPKLRFSRNLLSDFLADPAKSEAHISILHDGFMPMVSLHPTGPGRSGFLHGLMQEMLTEFSGTDASFAWRRQLANMECLELPPVAVAQLIADITRRIGELQSASASGKFVAGIIPTLEISLKQDEQSLLYQMHSVSDWVFTLDRHIGLDYFDSEASNERALYMLDYTPEFATSDSVRLLLTTRAIDEVEQMIYPELQERGLDLGEGVSLLFLQLLRSLSGRLAFKMISTPNAVSEALGLAMARLFLEQYGLLKNRIVIPLDAHLELFAGNANLQAQGDLGTALNNRGDLLLISCNPKQRLLQCHIIEVKWRAEAGDELSAYLTLRQQIENQTSNTEASLRQHFDQNAISPDRVDRALKNKQLISLLIFYLQRSKRYGLLDDDQSKKMLEFLQTLDEGFSFNFDSAGLIFDFGYRGIQQDEEHTSLRFHRIGRDYIEKLISNALTRRERLQEQARSLTVEEAIHQMESRELISHDTSMSQDPSYERVRTSFNGSNQEVPPLTEGSKSEQLLYRDPEPLQANPQSTSKVLIDTQKASTKEDLLSPAIDAQNVSASSMASHQLSDSTLNLSRIRTDNEISIVSNAHVPKFDVLLGENSATNQYGILGKAGDRVLALDLSGTNTISLFGAQGGGKSYTVGTILEMATKLFAGVNRLPSPLASVVFHYHESQDYEPEFVSMVTANSRETELSILEQTYSVKPGALEDVVILTPADKVELRKSEFPSVIVRPINFASSELQIKDWRFLMGVTGTQMYMKQINLILRQMRSGITLESLRQEIQSSDLSDSQKNIALTRLRFADGFINDQQRLGDMLRPGRLIIVDLRDELIEKDEALGLFVVMLNIFASAGRSEGFNKMIVFDEAHKYMNDPDLTTHIVDVIRQMRHQGVSIVIASQDPPSLPAAIIELSSLIILHRFNSPQWLKHVQRSITALSDLTPGQLAALRAGEAFVWAAKATERIFTQKAVRMQFRPRVTQHGGTTKRVGD